MKSGQGGGWSVEETGGHFAKLSQSDKQILYDLTYTWNEDKQNSQKQSGEGHQGGAWGGRYC